MILRGLLFKKIRQFECFLLERSGRKKCIENRFTGTTPSGLDTISYHLPAQEITRPDEKILNPRRSVNPSEIDRVIAYIANQHEHHRKKTFQEEYRAFLNKYNVEYEEKYVWE